MGGPNKKIIEEKCLKCHSAQRIILFKRTSQDWAVIVRRMKEKDLERLSDKEESACVEFLIRNYALTGRDSFESLCVRCHAMAGKKQLLYQRKTIPGWSRAIERMRRKYSFFIDAADAGQINVFWTNLNNNKNLKLNLGEPDFNEGVFEDKCGRCHTYAFMYGQKKTRSGWLEVLIRMQGKSPSWIGQQDVPRIKTHIFSNKKLLLDKN
jgi:hypothetical protein